MSGQLSVGFGIRSSFLTMSGELLLILLFVVVDVAFVVLLFECVCCLLLLLLSFAVAFANRPRIEIWECIICTVLYLKT